MDTTHFKRRFAVIVLMDSLTKKVLYFRFIPQEKNLYYKESIFHLIEKGIYLQSITCDGRRGVLQGFPAIPTQMCLFHQIGRMIFYLTRKPKSDAGQTRLVLSYSLKEHTQESFKIALEEWYEQHQAYLDERSETNQKRFKHRKLRSAYRSLKCSINYLFTYQKHPSLHISETTNLLEGLFKEMKATLTPHQGLSDNNKMMFIKDFLNRKS